MNTFLLAAVALGLVSFLMISRKRRAAAGSSPAESRSPGRSRRRKAAAPAPAPTPPMTAMAETAASRTLSPVMDAPPVAPPAPSIQDWTPVEMIVEPGWPLPGEIAGTGTWPAGGPAPAPDPAPEPDPVALAEEWTMPPAIVAEAAPAEPEAPPAPEAYEPPAREDAPELQDAAEPAMEAWLPGVSEVEPVPAIEPLSEIEPLVVASRPEPDPPALVWTEPDPETPEGSQDEPAPALAAPPLWSPPAEIAEAVFEETGYEETAYEETGYEATSFEEAPYEEPAAAAVEPVWEAAPSPEPAPFADLGDQSREIARLLPRAVAGLSPLLSASDQIGVTPRMAIVLRTLADGPRGLPDLGRALGVSRPVVADICARLETLGLVGRERDAGDRRRVLVGPTAKGLRLADETAPRIDAGGLAGALERLSPVERDALVSAVRTLTESLRRPA